MDVAEKEKPNSCSLFIEKTGHFVLKSFLWSGFCWFLSCDGPVFTVTCKLLVDFEELVKFNLGLNFFFSGKTTL